MPWQIKWKLLTLDDLESRYAVVAKRCEIGSKLLLITNRHYSQEDMCIIGKEESRKSHNYWLSNGMRIIHLECP